MLESRRRAMQAGTVLVMCGLAWLLVSSAAAEAATLTGTVKTQFVGQEAKPQAGVAVSVLDPESGESVASTTTSSSGEYSVAAPSGVFDIRFDPPAESAAGGTTVQSVDLTKNATVNVVLIGGEGVRFKGSVRTAAGEPVAGLRLYFDSSNPEVAAETGPEGNFSVLLSPGTYRFAIEYLGGARPGVPAGFWEWDLKSLTLEKDRSADLVLPKTARLNVHVTGSEGAPLPGAAVDIGPLSHQQELGGLGTGNLFQNELTRTTDAEGNVTTTVFEGWAGKGTVRPPQSSGYGNTPFSIPAVAGDTTLEVKAQSAITFKGSVRTAAGEPVAGLRLYFDSSNPEVAAETGPEGNFSVLLSPGTYRFAIEYLGGARPGVPAGFWEWDLKSLTLEKDRSAELVLPKTARLNVHVTGSEGAPLPGAAVDIGPLSHQQELGGLGTGNLFQNELTRTTDAEGNVTTTVFEGWAGKGTVRPPQSSGYGNTPFSIPAVAGDTTLEVKAQQAITFKGSVRTAAGEPVAGLRLYFDSSNPEVAAETGPEGNFSVLLSPGTYRFAIEYLGGARPGVPAGFWEWDLKSLTLEKDRSAELVLPKTARLTVHVTGSEGAPLPGAAVDIGPLSHQQELGGLGTGNLFQNELTRTTDAEGNVTTTVFEGWAGKGTVRPPQSSGYGNTPFSIPAVAGDTTMVLNLGAGEVPTEDVDAPLLDQLAIEPDVVNPAASAQTVILSAHITDNLSGFKAGNVYFRSPSGKQQAVGFEFKRVAGDAKNGTYEIPVTFKQFSENGTWEISVIHLTDQTGNERALEPKEIEELGLAHQILVLSGEGGEDTEAPQVEGLSIEPAEINTTVSAQTIRVNAHIIDNFTGFKSGSIFFTSPSGGQQTAGFEFIRVNGDAVNGGYEIPVTFKQGSESGVWTVSAIRVTDAAGNERLIEPEEMEGKGFTRRITVQSGEGGEDIQAPKMSQLFITPEEVDTASSGQTVTLYGYITDDLSGFKSGSVFFRSPSGKQEVAGFEFKRVAGEAKAGTYEIPVTFKRFSETGTWQISAIHLTDQTGNERLLEPKQIEELALSHTVVVRGEAEPEEPVDTDPPHLEGLSIEPAEIDTSVAKQPVSVIATISDNLSGFEAGAVAFVSPNGEQVVEGGEFEPLSEAEGVYRAVVTFPQGSEPGEWEIAKVWLRDRAGNAVSIPGAEIENAGLPHTVTVKPPPPPVVTGLSPSSGPEGGGTEVKISGSGFANATVVRFGSAPAKFEVASPNSIVAIAPAGMGTVDLTVTTPGGTSEAGAPGRFSYLPQVALSSSPNPSVQGQKVTFTAQVATGAGPVATGTATFVDGVATLGVVALDGKGAATLSSNKLGTGEHQITVAYSGDANHLAAKSKPLTQVVSKRGPPR